jgi:hypothetical protein
MKKVLLFLTILIIAACTERNPNGSVKLNRPQSDGALGNPTLVEVDSCEYITWGHGLAHKGDCKYCAERRKKEFYEMIDVLFNTEKYDSISSQDD